MDHERLRGRVEYGLVRDDGTPRAATPASSLGLALQRTAGNWAVASLLGAADRAVPGVDRTGHPLSAGLPTCLARAIPETPGALAPARRPVQHVRTSIQRLGESDYPDAGDRRRVVEGLVAAIQANPAGLDWTQLMAHIGGQNHNASQPVGNSSTFGGVAANVIAGYVRSVIAAFAPGPGSAVTARLSNTTLVLESTTGGFCNGHGVGPTGATQPRTNVRVTFDVNAVQDDEWFAQQLDSIIVTNAYPIP
jgi:hypothetical protein